MAVTTTLTTETSITSICNWWNHVSAPVSGTFTLSLGEIFTTVIFYLLLNFVKINSNATI